jgi:hypothetical protein
LQLSVSVATRPWNSQQPSIVPSWTFLK